jgi:hypothetical protein
MEFSQVSWSVIEVLTPAIAALVAALVGLATKWLAARIGNEQAKRVLADLADEVDLVVREVEQTLVEKLKTARKDGKLTEAERADALKAALDTVKRNLGTRGVAMLQRATGLGETALEGYLRTRIEASIHGLRAR